jgi:AAA15 family ATPase/GTPase
MSIGGGKMANHIKYIDIHKFKGIKDINIYDMKSINIFVGDNNSGKTTILEAIKFFEKPFDYLSHLRLMSRKYNPRSIKYSKIKEIFNECKLENEININLESNGENYNLHIKGFEEEEIYFEDYELLGEDESNERTILEYTFNSEKREFILENRKKSRISLSKNNLKLINMGYAMPIDTYLEKSTLNAIDTVIKKGDKWKLIELLKIFDNSIIDINYTSDQEIYITTQDKSILSLSSFGDGLILLFFLFSNINSRFSELNVYSKIVLSLLSSSPSNS